MYAGFGVSLAKDFFVLIITIIINYRTVKR